MPERLCISPCPPVVVNLCFALVSPRHIAIACHHPRLRFNHRAITRAVALLDGNARKFRNGCPVGDLSLVFLTDKALAVLHANFLHDPSPTDVITFEGDPALGTAGEVCVSADAALRHVASRRSALSAELTLYLVHGWLHLAGYDDLVPAKKRVMRRAEARALTLLRTASAIPKFSFRR